MEVVESFTSLYRRRCRSRPGTKVAGDDAAARDDPADGDRHGERGDASLDRATRERARLVDPDWDAPAVEALRAVEFARLDATGHAYLDYTGGGLYPASLLQAHQRFLRDRVLGNPHSDNPTSRAVTRYADGARAAILRFLHADPEEYLVVFTANATAALKLVGEAFPFGPGSRFLLTADNHNSVNGIRAFAGANGAHVTYVPLLAPALRVADPMALAELDRRSTGGASLFAFPTQSNYSGVRHPLRWIWAAHDRGWRVLLDASAFVPTNSLDLARWHPEFVVMSWYKVFGYPTGIGSLVVRRDALARLRRPWFAGGSIGLASVVVPRHTLGAGVLGFEDGTIDYLGLPAIEMGLETLESVGLPTIHRRVQALTRWLLGTLLSLRHRDGSPKIRLYGPRDDLDRGGTIPFNLLDRDGGIVDSRRVEAAASARGVSIRTGCFCNPGASETARGITAVEMESVFAPYRPASVAELRALMPGKALGAVRASVGIATNERDVDRLVDVLEAI